MFTPPPGGGVLLKVTFNVGNRTRGSLYPPVKIPYDRINPFGIGFHTRPLILPGEGKNS